LYVITLANLVFPESQGHN